MNVLDRFLRYVRYDTQSDETSRTYPSTDRQLVLLPIQPDRHAVTFVNSLATNFAVRGASRMPLR